MRVHVAGELDIARVDDLRAQLRAASAVSDEVAIDLSLLDFIDCAGVHCIAEVARDAAQQGRQLRIEEPMRPQVRRVFTLLRDVVGSPPAPASLAA
jgi:anti-anti-sigma factor